MNKTRVFISRKLPVMAENLLENAGFEVRCWDQEPPMPKEKLISECQNADALLCTSGDSIDAAFLNACAHLRIVSIYAVGYDNIDIRTASQLGIPIGHTPGVLTDATAEIAFGLMIAVARNFLDAHRTIDQGSWKYFNPIRHLGMDLKNKTLGIFGLGAIGYEMARRCKAVYDMPIIYHNRSVNKKAEAKLGAQRVSFEKLLQESDVLSVHAALNSETREIFNQQAFAQMKNTAIFLNTARGGLHHEKDLIRALQDQQIWGAGLDVTNPEPMVPGNPLLQLPRVIVLPHIGSATFFTRSEMARLAAENIITFFREGRPVHQVRI
jgi:glyoxylate reductase